MSRRQKYGTALMAALVFMAAPGPASPAAAARFAGAAPVSNAQLARMRGGFSIDRGRVRLSFGIERLSFINGDLAALTRLGPANGYSVHIIRNGDGNFITPRLRGTLSNSVLAAVIQNSLDGQTISNVNVFNITVTSAQAARLLSVHDSILDALTR